MQVYYCLPRKERFDKKSNFDIFCSVIASWEINGSGTIFSFAPLLVIETTAKLVSCSLKLRSHPPWTTWYLHTHKSLTQGWLSDYKLLYSIQKHFWKILVEVSDREISCQFWAALWITECTKISVLEFLASLITRNNWIFWLYL